MPPGSASGKDVTAALVLGGSYQLRDREPSAGPTSASMKLGGALAVASLLLVVTQDISLIDDHERETLVSWSNKTNYSVYVPSEVHLLFAEQVDIWRDQVALVDCRAD
eukprot:5284194-Amphidinium_carterae.2